MRRILLRSFAFAAAAVAASFAAQAADMPMGAPIVRAPVPVIVPVFGWTGCYIGAHGGWAAGTNSLFYQPAGGVDFGGYDIDGGFAGGQVGCNYQTGSLVFGVEGAVAWANIKGSVIDPANTDVTGHYESKWLASLTGRIGFAVDRALIYAKGGAAVIGAEHWLFDAAALGKYATAKDTRWGWTVGGGVEYAFARNWSIKAEYNYYDFAGYTVGLACPFGCADNPANIDIHPRFHSGLVGVNFRF